LLRLGSEQVQVVGIVLDKDRCQIALAGLDGQLRHAAPIAVPTPTTYADLLNVLSEHARPLISNPATTLGIGLSVPGQINRHTGQTVFSPNLHLTDGQTPAVDLTERLGIPCVLVQEAHALCLGERWHGGAKGMDNFALMDVTTGLGLGVMSGGRLLTGHSGLAGELGHVTAVLDGEVCGCGNRGCLETLATDAALTRAVARRLGRPITIDEVVSGLQSGELSPEPELQRTCDYLAVAMAAVINVFNPSTLFVYGRLLDARPGLFDELRERVRQRSLRPSFADCQLERAQASKMQGALAAAVGQLTRSLAPTVDAN
jgi:N-acetylglucosamine repressor